MDWKDACPREAAWTQPPQGWSWINCPGKLLGEESLQQALRNTDWGLIKRDPDGFWLAFPFSAGGPFPIPPLFCLSHCEALEGRWYVLFRFSRRGWVEPPV